MFAMFSPFVFFFKLNLLSGRLAHISNCINGALSEKYVRFVQNPRTKSARRRNNCKLELLAWTTFNHKGLRKCSNDCLGVETSTMQHHVAGNLTLIMLTLLQHLWDSGWGRRKLSKTCQKCVKTNQNQCRAAAILPRYRTRTQTFLSVCRTLLAGDFLRVIT